MSKSFPEILSFTSSPSRESHFGLSRSKSKRSNDVLVIQKANVSNTLQTLNSAALPDEQDKAESLVADFEEWKKEGESTLAIVVEEEAEDPVVAQSKKLLKSVGARHHQNKRIGLAKDLDTEKGLEELETIEKWEKIDISGEHKKT